jgi:hypothetical protein
MFFYNVAAKLLYIPPHQCHYISRMDFVASPPGCGRSVTDFWGLDAHEAQLRCPDEVDGDTWILSTRKGLNLRCTKLPRPWSQWETSPSRNNPHVRAGSPTRDLMISSQKLRPLDHDAGHFCMLFRLVSHVLRLNYVRCVDHFFNRWPLGSTLSVVLKVYRNEQNGRCLEILLSAHLNTTNEWGLRIRERIGWTSDE